MSHEEFNTDFLAEALYGGSHGGIHNTALAVIDILDEVTAWLSDSRPWDGRHATAWQSAADELEVSLNQGGNNLRNLVEPPIRKFRIGEAIGQARKGSGSVRYLQMIKTARELAVSDEGLRASWKDLVVAAAGTSRDDILARLEQLVRIEFCRGSETRERHRTVGGVVSGHFLDVEVARSLVDPDHEVPADLLSGDHQRPSAMELPDRLALAEEYLCLPGPTADYVVWLAVENSSMRHISLKLDGMTFFSSEFISANVKLPSDQRNPGLPPEILSAPVMDSRFPNDRFALLVRVEMGRRSSSFVSRDARRRLSTLLAPASRIFQSDWRVTEGSVVFCDGKPVGWSIFERVEETPTTFRLDAIADDWVDSAAGRQLATMLAGPLPDEVERFLELVEWDSSHRRADSLATVLLAIRTIETISMSFLGGTEWDGLLRKYQSWLAWGTMRLRLATFAEHLLPAYERHSEEEGRDRLREIFLEVTSHSANRSTTNLARFVALLPELIAVWAGSVHIFNDIGIERSIRVDEMNEFLELWTDPQAFEARLNRTEEGIALQIGRVHRLRNAAQHGGPVPAVTVGSAALTADLGRRQILQDVLDQLMAGRPPGAALDALERLSGQRIEELRTSGEPMSALALTASFP